MSQGIEDVIEFLEGTRDAALEGKQRLNRAADEAYALGPGNLMGESFRQNALVNQRWANNLDEAIAMLRDALRERR